MSQSFSWTVTAPGVNKTQAAILAMEFWTSQGFAEHTSSYNRLVLRRNGYGTASNWLKTAWSGYSGTWDQAPMELVILIQILPDHATYGLELRSSWDERKHGDFQRFTNALVDGFIKFNNEWTAHAQRALDQ